LAAAVVYDRGGALRYSPRHGREIVLALDALRQKGLDRDGEERYFMKSE
jgi:hypothetical protein